MVTLPVFFFNCKLTVLAFFCCACVKKRMLVIDATHINTTHNKHLCIHGGWLKDGYRSDACMLLLFAWKQAAEIQGNI